MAYAVWLCCITTLLGQSRIPTEKVGSKTTVLTDLVVEKGELLELKVDSLLSQRIIVKGTLRAYDKASMVIVANQIEIDGGRFEVGTKEKPRTNSFMLLLNGTSLNPGSLIVKNKGQLVLNGVVANQNKAIDFDKMEIDKIPIPSRLLTVTTNTVDQFGFIEIEEASKVSLSGVLFQNLGIKETKPALSWFGKTPAGAMLEKCVFTASRYTDLFLDKTMVSVTENLFFSTNGSSINCAPSGVGFGNSIFENTLINGSGQGTFALVTNNPFQSIIGNDVIVRNATNGIGLLALKEYKNYKWSFKDSFFELNNNRIHAHDPPPRAGTIGLQVDDFDHKGIWRSSSNRIANFALGAQTSSKNLVLKGYHFQNNTVGIAPGVAYLQESSLGFDTKQPGSTAVWASDSGHKSAPKVTDLIIENYAVGFHIEGKVGANNYFEKISYKKVLQSLKFKELHPTAILFDKDRSFSQLPLPPEEQKKETSVKGHHHGGKGKHKGIYLFHSNASISTKDSSPLPSDPRVFTASVENFGTLTIATGFGLEDPVHEHSQQFNSLLLKNTETTKRFIKEDALDNETFFLAANTTYDFEYGANSAPLYDLSFEWEAPEDTWVMLRFKYTHPNIQALRSFGSLIKPAASMHELMHQNETSYFYDPMTETALVKIYNHSNRDELVIYSSDVLTEIKVDGQNVPISVYNEDEKIVISYNLPKEMNSTLTLNDHYGNPIKVLHEGTSPPGKIHTEFDLKEFNVREGVFLYFLSIGDQTHKGPVYAY